MIIKDNFSIVIKIALTNSGFIRYDFDVFFINVSSENSIMNEQKCNSYKNILWLFLFS